MTAEAQLVERPIGQWLSPKQAGERAQRHERTVRNALHEYVSSRGKRGLRGFQEGPGCCWRIDREDVDAWVRGERPAARRLRRAS
jgi:hypothetical protein